MKQFILLGSLALISTASAAGLNGAIILAADGTFLGTCSGTYGSTSIANNISPYGSTIGTHSMFNTIGTYGSTISMYSPHNSISMQAPYLLSADSDLLSLVADSSYNFSSRAKNIIAKELRTMSISTPRVSANTFFMNGIDPDTLRRVCAKQ